MRSTGGRGSSQGQVSRSTGQPFDRVTGGFVDLFSDYLIARAECRSKLVACADAATDAEKARKCEELVIRLDAIIANGCDRDSRNAGLRSTFVTVAAAVRNSGVQLCSVIRTPCTGSPVAAPRSSVGGLSHPILPPGAGRKLSRIQGRVAASRRRAMTLSQAYCAEGERGSSGGDATAACSPP